MAVEITDRDGSSFTFPPGVDERTAKVIENAYRIGAQEIQITQTNQKPTMHEISAYLGQFGVGSL